MTKLVFDIDEKNDVVFNLGISTSGIYSNNISVITRLMLDAGDVSLCFNCSHADSGTLLASLPPMNKYIEPGTYDACLETIIEGKYVRVLKLALEFVQRVNVSADVVDVVVVQDDADQRVTVNRMTQHKNH